MTGRHRQTRTTGAQRALAASVPAPGLAGVVTAPAGSEPGAAPDANASAPTPAVTPVAAVVPATSGGPALSGVAADAARAADRATVQQRDEERRALEAVVDDVRADAQDREAAAAAQGRERLDEFRRDLEQQRAQPAGDGDRPTDTSRADNSDRSTDGGFGESCDLSGPAQVGEPADPHEIVGRDCGLVGLFGQERSADPWIDGQLRSALGDS